MHREKLVVELESLQSLSTGSLEWPKIGVTPSTAGAIDAVSTFNFANFQTNYIDIIPKQWAVVSISLSENQQELYISRFQSGQRQLMVRLPFTRHNACDDSEEIFEYKTGLEEFREIIQLSDTNTRTSTDMKEEIQRSKWWDQRKALDDRLKEFLEKIEYYWLRGFKGVFSQYPINPALFAKFKHSFDDILSRHIPSRKKKKAAKVEADDRILELFITLGHPNEQDLDEALVDLMEFVIDILQFHGEGNAYDEIDTDRVSLTIIMQLIIPFMLSSDLDYC
jgi:separase